MNAASVWRYAFRNLWRQPRRTLLAMIGAGVGCAIGVLATSWISGAAAWQEQAIIDSGAGHFRYVPEGWLKDRDVKHRLVNSAGLAERLRATPLQPIPLMTGYQKRPIH